MVLVMNLTGESRGGRTVPQEVRLLHPMLRVRLRSIYPRVLGSGGLCLRGSVGSGYRVLNRG